MFPQTNPYKAPLYWSVYEYHYVKEQAGVTDNYIPESELSANINWVEQNLKPYGYTMVCMDGWGDVLQLNENGYRKSHSAHWEHDFAYWSAYLQSKGMTLGMYGNPLWINVSSTDTTTKIVGTNINVSSLINTSENAKWFTWVQVDRPGAEQYVKGCVKYYADMGIKYFRVDFLSWYESGTDHYMGTVGVAHTRAQYEKALRWMREACDSNGVFLSLVMPHLNNEAEYEKVYGHMFRINSDCGTGAWDRFSDLNRGIRFSVWSQYENAMDGYAYWSYLSGRNKVLLDGDFIRINTFASNAEKRSVISQHAIAGGPISVADEYSTIGDNLWLFQNNEILALNKDGFAGKPLSNIPTSDSSQIWTGQLSTGEWIVALFNRESSITSRTLSLNQLGLTGKSIVRDLWQHAELGNLDTISAKIAPHGCLVCKVGSGTTAKVPQSITFNAIANKLYSDSDFVPTAVSSSGLPVTFEVASGPASIVNNKIHLTGTNGIVYVTAYQAGNDSYCAAVPQVQSFSVKGHQSYIYIGGTFTNWSLNIPMYLNDNIWTARNIKFSDGNYQLKFANTNNWTGDDWGNASGLTGTASLSTGGSPNLSFQIADSGYYTITFNDITLEYAITKQASYYNHQLAMYFAGTFNNWVLNTPMKLVHEVWAASAVAIPAGSQQMKFANTANWTGDDWGNSSGLSGTAQLTTGGKPNITFTVASAGIFDLSFDDITLAYSITPSVTKVSEEPILNFELSQNYPNPFNPATKIRYSLPAAGQTRLEIFNILGKLVTTVIDKYQTPGSYEVSFNAGDYPSGLYFYKLKSGSYSAIRKMMLVK
jgi:hypothetical protein